MRASSQTLFADDILLFLFSPLLSFPILLSRLDLFPAISGLVINSEKSKVLNASLSQALLSHLQQVLPFSWSSHYTPYLGIKLTANPVALYSINYPPMLTHLTNLVSSWSTLPLAWLGCITVSKMSILLKIIYLFWVLPVPVPVHPHFLCILIHMGQN